MHRTMTAIQITQLLDDARKHDPALDWVWADNRAGRGYRIAHPGAGCSVIYLDGHLPLSDAINQLLTAVAAHTYGANADVLPFTGRRLLG